MSLSAAQQRALNRIEKTLANDDFGLGPRFAIFTSLAGHEAMPVTERVTARSWRRRMRRIWPAVATVTGLAVVTGALIFSHMLPGRQACPGTVTSASAHVQSAGTGRQPACTPRQIRQGALPPR
jgi:Protein of unknown function (DUF3040)